MPNFPTVPAFDTTEETVRFRLIAHTGDEIRCVASREFFEDHFSAGAAPESWLAAYLANADQINKLAADVYAETGLSPVLLHSDNL